MTDEPTKTARLQMGHDRHGSYWSIYRGETMLAYCDNSSRAQSIVDALNAPAHQQSAHDAAQGLVEAQITGRGIPGMDLKFARQHISDVKRMNLFKAPEVRDLMFAVENMLDYLEVADFVAKDRQ